MRDCRKWLGWALLAVGATFTRRHRRPPTAAPIAASSTRMYCDENKDMVADVADRSEEMEEPVDDRLHLHAGRRSRGLREHLQAVHDAPRACLDKKVVFYQVQSNAAEIEAMRSGRLHVGGFSTGPTAFAVNLAGAMPFAVKGNEKEFQGYNLIVIVKASSPVPEARPTSRARKSRTRRRRRTRDIWRRSRCSRRRA